MVLTIVIFYITAILNIAVGFNRRKSKTLCALALLIIFLLMTFNSEGPDIDNYFLAYDSWIDSSGHIVKFGHMEWAYMYLMAGFKKLGFDFISFRIVLTIICLALFINTINYYKANVNIVAGFYMLYLFFFDTIQLRNCVMQFLLLFATRYIFQKSFRSFLKYILMIVIASGFHIIALFSLLFLITKFSNKKRYYKNICYLAFILLILCICLQPILPQIASWMLQFIHRGSSYFEINVKLGYLVILILHLIGLVTLYVCRRGVKTNCIAKARIDNILKINIVLCLFMPFMFINSNFYRIFRNNIILTMIGLSLVYSNSNNTSTSTKAAIALLLMNIGWFIRDMFIKNDIKVIIYPIFSGNYLLDFTPSININEWLIVTFVTLLLILAAKLIKQENKKGICVQKRTVK